MIPVNVNFVLDYATVSLYVTVMNVLDDNEILARARELLVHDFGAETAASIEENANDIDFQEA